MPSAGIIRKRVTTQVPVISFLVIFGEVRGHVSCYTDLLISKDVTNLYSSITKYLPNINTCTLGMKIGIQGGMGVGVASL